MRVEEICARDVVDIAADASLVEAAESMRRNHVGALVVCDGADGGPVPIGIITDRDIVVSAIAAGLPADALQVHDVMTQPARTCGISDDVFDAVAAMRTHGVRRLPVVDDAGRLAGIVSADDIWRIAAVQLGALSEALAREQVREMHRRA